MRGNPRKAESRKDRAPRSKGPWPYSGCSFLRAPSSISSTSSRLFQRRDKLRSAFVRRGNGTAKEGFRGQKGKLTTLATVGVSPGRNPRDPRDGGFAEGCASRGISRIVILCPASRVLARPRAREKEREYVSERHIVPRSLLSIARDPS